MYTYLVTLLFSFPSPNEIYHMTCDIMVRSSIPLYSLTGQVLEKVMNVKHLEVTLSNDLKWSKHIATMTNKANSKLSFLVATEGLPREA